MSDGFIKLCFAAVFLVALSIFAASSWFSVRCYMSGDPNSMACYMLNERSDITIRQR